MARHLGLEESEGEDFGQTLAGWGVGDGPYLVLPFLGPSTLRDTAGLPVDWTVDPIDRIEHVATRNTVWVLSLLNTRVQLLEAEALISGDRYVFLREVYLQRRDYLINNGQVEQDEPEEGEEEDPFGF